MINDKDKQPLNKKGSSSSNNINKENVDVGLWAFSAKADSVGNQIRLFCDKCGEQMKFQNGDRAVLCVSEVEGSVC